MARVECKVDYEEMEGEYSRVEGTVVTCTKCGHQVRSYGIKRVSVRRCLILMRKQCPRGEKNKYVREDA